MQLGAYEIAIIGIGGTIIGSLTGTWVGYRLSLQLSAITARREANKNFISIFHRELSGLYPYPIKWPKNIVEFLESKFTILNAAVSDFRDSLPPKKWDAFDKVWFSFYNATGREIDNENCQCYLHYISGESATNPNSKEVITITDGKKNFKHNVNYLLSYTKQK